MEVGYDYSIGLGHFGDGICKGEWIMEIDVESNDVGHFSYGFH